MVARGKKKAARRVKDLPVKKLGASKARHVKGGAALKNPIVGEKVGPDHHR